MTEEKFRIDEKNEEEKIEISRKFYNLNKQFFTYLQYCYDANKNSDFTPVLEDYLKFSEEIKLISRNPGEFKESSDIISMSEKTCKKRKLENLNSSQVKIDIPSSSLQKNAEIIKKKPFISASIKEKLISAPVCRQNNINNFQDLSITNQNQEIFNFNKNNDTSMNLTLFPSNETNSLTKKIFDDKKSLNYSHMPINNISTKNSNEIQNYVSLNSLAQPTKTTENSSASFSGFSSLLLNPQKNPFPSQNTFSSIFEVNSGLNNPNIFGASFLQTNPSQNIAPIGFSSLNNPSTSFITSSNIGANVFSLASKSGESDDNEQENIPVPETNDMGYEKDSICSIHAKLYFLNSGKYDELGVGIFNIKSIGVDKKYFQLVFRMESSRAGSILMNIKVEKNSKNIQVQKNLHLLITTVPNPPISEVVNDIPKDTFKTVTYLIKTKTSSDMKIIMELLKDS